MTEDEKSKLKAIERHRRRHREQHERSFAREARRAQRALRRIFNIREGRAPYHVIRRRFLNGARLTGTHICILIIAMIIACVGLDTNSDIAIIGAMLICPIMGSVLAIAYGAATMDKTVTRAAIGGLAVQMVFCLTTSTIYFALSPAAGMTTALSDNSIPTVWDLILALAGGFAGGLGNSRDQEPATLISGVAVATALMPPLCAAGYGIAAAEPMLAISALYEFGINVVFISLSAELVLLLLRVPLKCDLNEDGIVTAHETAEARTRSHRLRHRILLGSALFAIPCIVLTASMIKPTPVNEPVDFHAKETAQELAIVCPDFKSYDVSSRAVAQDEDTDDDTAQVAPQEEIVAHVTTGKKLSKNEKDVAERLIRLNVKSVDRVEFLVE